jgi:hypothetical protein
MLKCSIRKKCTSVCFNTTVEHWRILTYLERTFYSIGLGSGTGTNASSGVNIARRY